MTKMSVGEFKTKFSEAIELVKGGEEVEVLYGRGKEPVARLVPVAKKKTGSILGLLEGKASYTMADDWDVTPEELLEP